MQALLDADDNVGNEAVSISGQQAQQGQQEQWQQVASLLGRKHDRIDPVLALPLLPPQVRHMLPVLCSSSF